MRTIVKLYLEKELILDLSGSPSNEWIIETDQNRIIYFSFLTNDHVDLQQISPFLTVTNKITSIISIIFKLIITKSIKIVDGNKPASKDGKSLSSSFYSTGNTVSIKITNLPSNLIGFQLKAQKV